MVTAVAEIIDAHKYQCRLIRALRFLNNQAKIGLEKEKYILGFLEHIKAEGLSLARQVSYVQWLTAIAVMLGKSFDKADKHDTESLFARINGRNWSDATKGNHKEAIKFWRWLKDIGVSGRRNPKNPHGQRSSRRYLNKLPYPLVATATY